MPYFLRTFVLITTVLFATKVKSATYTVTIPGGNDTLLSCGTPGSYLAALCDAKNSPGRDTIIFDLPAGSPLTSPQTLINVTDSDLLIDGTSVNDGSTVAFNVGLTLKGSSIDIINTNFDGTVVGILIEGNDNSLTKCTVGNSLGNGITVTSANNLIDSCIIENNTLNGMVFTGLSADSNETYGSVFRHNTMDGLQIEKGSSNNITGKLNSGNTFHNNDHGIHILNDGVGPTDQNTHRFNSFYCNDRMAIELEDGGNNEYYSNADSSETSEKVELEVGIYNWGTLIKGKCGVVGTISRTIIIDFYMCDTICPATCCDTVNPIDLNKVEGMIYLGSTQTTTNDFTLNLDSILKNVSGLTMLFTELPGTPGVSNTSEFKAGCLTPIEPGNCNLPILIEMAGNDTVCPGDIPTLTIAGTEFDALNISDLIFDWYSFPDNQLVATINGDKTYSTTEEGYYYVKVRDTANSSLSDCFAYSNAFFAGYFEPPRVDVPDQSTCDGDPQVTIYSLTDKAVEQYIWSDNGTGTASSTTGSVPGNYTLEVIDENGCRDTSTGVLSINALPIVTVSDNMVCDGDPAVFTVNSDSVIATFLWSGNGTGTGPTTSGTVAGNYTVEVVDINGCTSTATGELVVFAAPVVTLSINPPALCADAALIPLSGGSPAGGDYNGPGITNGIFDAGAVGTGTYVTYVYTDNNGCNNYATDVIVVNSPITSSVTSTPICKGDELPNVNAAGFGGTPPYQYNWFDLTGNPQTSSVLIATDGSFSVEVTDQFGCKDTSTVSVSVYNLPDVTVNDAFICKGDTEVIFTANAVGTNLSFSWSENGTGTLPTTTGKIAGNYTVQVTDINGCIGTATGKLTVEDAPQLNIADISFCEGQSMTLDAGIDNVIYQWSPGGESTKAIQVSNSGMYYLTVTDLVSSCSSNDTVLVQRLANPTLSFEGIAKVCKSEGETTVISAIPSSLGPGIFTWNLQNQMDSIAFVEDHGWLILNYTDQNGCAVKDSLLIEEDCPPPPINENTSTKNVFSFTASVPQTIFTLPASEIDAVSNCSYYEIYNRWGRKLYEGSGNAVTWDGTYKGELVSTGVYFWIYGCDKSRRYNGFFHVIVKK